MELLTKLLKTDNLEDFVGQKHIIGQNTPLFKLIKSNQLPHMFFYGTPGTGKTTLAKIIANQSNSECFFFNATSLKVEQLREVFTRYTNTLIKPIVFIDEVHRLSKNQQEVLLPIMENNNAVIIGASTENPYHSLTNAIRSRAFLYEFLPHSSSDMSEIIQKAKKILKDINIDEECEQFLIQSSSSDARAMLNLLDYCYKVSPDITLENLKQLRQSNMQNSTSSSQTHYDLASAMIKSIRGSDVDASIYYLARLIYGAEDISFITRRLVISASEDIGNANPNALNIAVNAKIASEQIGYPEARIILAQCVVYLASCPKSFSSYKAINNALGDIKNGEILNIPSNISSNSKTYQNPHNSGGWNEQKYLEKDKYYYNSSKIGYEKTLDEWLEKIKQKEGKR